MPTSPIGRDREAQALRLALSEAVEPGSRVVIVRGEAGSGKTLLLEAFLAEAAERGARVIAGRADLSERGVPYAPLHHGLSRLNAQNPSARASDLAERLMDAMTPSHTGGPFPEGSRSAAVFDAGWRLLSQLAEDGSVVLAIDDVHAADEETLALLASIVRRLAALPVLLVITERTNAIGVGTALDAFHAQLDADCRVSVVEVGELDDEAVERLVRQVAGDVATPDAVRRIGRRTAGNAFVVAELAAALRDEGALDDDRVSSSRGLTIVRRLLPSSGDALRLARVLAACGEIRLGQLPSLGTVAGLEPSSAEAAFDALVRARLLVRRNAGTFGFRHEILREALYADLGPAEQHRIHLGLAAQLDALRRSGGAIDVATVARHAVAAADGPNREASALAQAAGDDVAHLAPRSAAGWYAEAVRLLRHEDPTRGVCLARQAESLMRSQNIADAIELGREALAEIADDRERMRCLSNLVLALARRGDERSHKEALELVSDELDLGRDHPRLLMGRGAILTIMGRLPEAAADVDRARELLPAASGIEHLLTIASGVRIAETRGDLREVDRLLTEQVEVASTLPRPAQHYSHGVAAQVLAHDGRIRRAEPHLRSALELRGDDAYLAIDDRIEMAAVLVDFYSGDWDRALERAARSSVLLAEAGVSACLPYLETVEVMVRSARGDIDGARSLARRDDSRYAPALMAVRLYTRGWLELLDRRPSTAKEDLESGRALAADAMSRTLITAGLARADGALGNKRHAGTHLDHCRELVSDYAVPRATIEVALAAAEVESDPVHARAAHEIAEAAGLPFFAGQALLLAGQLGDDPEASLTAAWRHFRALSADLWRRRAAFALRERGLPVPRAPRQSSNDLNEVEREVVRLVVEGLSNQAIAQRLSYSKHTINAYLTRIYARTGCASRFDLLRAHAAGEVEL